MKQKWFRQLLRRRFIIILLLILQVYVLILFINNTSQLVKWVNELLRIISLLAMLGIISSKYKPSYKLLWVILILLFPVFGGLFYLFVSFQTPVKRTEKKIEQLNREMKGLWEHGSVKNQQYQEQAAECMPQIRYLQNAGFPIYENTKATYLSPGERMFEELCIELKKAEKYIFIESFIIQEGVMWDTILEILIEKAEKGVEVRVLYDDLGCFLTLPRDYAKILEKFHIHCKVFNKFRPVLSSLQNNRDHRKIVSIDGKVAFTGGINLADEYINVKEKHGHWKDAAIKIEGNAAWSFTLMFLEMWSLAEKTIENFESFIPQYDHCYESDGFLQPYADSPVDLENVGEHVYLQIINNAKDYIYIHTPYFIVDDSMMSALKLAAKSGVDVRIVTPHRWDKRLIHRTTQSYYRDLVEAGVHVYEYSKGFIHSKVFISDDKVATVGTTNLDFRSLYLHFECGVWIYKNKAIMEAKEDFLKTLEICSAIREEDCKCNKLKKLLQELLRVFAPLM